ncbi:DUF1521 domain-containing protein [Paraburkholderia sp. BCC1884]|uniref:DUF1521 domain-containing protein n=1 Tax=Paraburkholderia sp. BCC1884 TaxID=2562668 RepID=UPI001183C132|nr:DUF1521 domain-containing protein [Paraburkholderia sp. BCC1884]
MQATMQTQLSFNSHQTYTTTPFGGASSPRSNAPAFGNPRNPSNQMANTVSGFSKTSFSVQGQTTMNGRSTPFIAQGTISTRSQGINPMPPGSGRDDRCASRTPPAPDPRCGCNDSGRVDATQWSNTPVSGNKSSIDLGDYKLDFSKGDSSMLLTDKKTGDTTNIYGDPHLVQHANSGNKTSAMFNGPMTFMLPDNTKVTVSTQAAKNNPSVSYADKVTITRGNQAYQVTGLSQENKAGLNVQKSNDGRTLDAATPDGYTVVAARNGTGWVDPATGKQPTADDLKKAA